MKKIGLLGGMSWESTVTYYQIVNQVIKQHLGGLHSAECIVYSVDFHEIEQCQARGEWEKSGAILAQAALSLQNAGADFLIICTNTMHKLVDTIQQAITIPVLHIADMTVVELKKKNLTTVALLGTQYTMKEDFYKARVAAAGIDVLIPDEAGMETINSVIYNELCKGVLSDTSRHAFLDIIGALEARGAQGVILGCTEIGLLVQPGSTRVPLFDTAQIHATAAAMYALAE